MRAACLSPPTAAAALVLAGITPGQPVPLWKKIVAGGTAGAIASGIANPTDLMKVRLQSPTNKYSGMVDAFTSIVKEEGVLGLWTGVGPTMGRATALAAAELATYDEVKTVLKAKAGMVDGLSLTLCTAFCSGYVSTVASSPFDVVKSRVMGQKMTPDGKPTMCAGSPMHAGAAALPLDHSPPPLPPPSLSLSPLALSPISASALTPRSSEALQPTPPATDPSSTRRPPSASSPPHPPGTTAWSTASSSLPRPRARCRCTMASGRTLAVWCRG